LYIFNKRKRKIAMAAALIYGRSTPLPLPLIVENAQIIETGEQ